MGYTSFLIQLFGPALRGDFKVAEALREFCPLLLLLLVLKPQYKMKQITKPITQKRGMLIKGEAVIQLEMASNVLGKLQDPFAQRPSLFVPL